MLVIIAFKKDEPVTPVTPTFSKKPCFSEITY